MFTIRVRRAGERSKIHFFRGFPQSSVVGAPEGQRSFRLHSQGRARFQLVSLSGSANELRRQKHARRPVHPRGHTQVFRTRHRAEISSKALVFSMAVETNALLSSVALGNGRWFPWGCARTPRFFAQIVECGKFCGIGFESPPAGSNAQRNRPTAWLSRSGSLNIFESCVSFLADAVFASDGATAARHNSRTYRKAIRRLAPDRRCGGL